MENTIKHAEQKLQQIKHACINCHPSMKAYYQEQYAKWNTHIQNLKSTK
jgi:formate-dependent nitrite reductase cytochrome c552 subunit